MSSLFGKTSPQIICHSFGKRKNCSYSTTSLSTGNTYNLFYVISGKCCAEVNGKPLVINKRESICLYPYSQIKVSANKEGNLSYCWIEFSGIGADYMLGETAFRKDNLCSCPIEIPEFERFFDIPESIDKTIGCQYRAAGKLMVLLSYYVDLFPKEESNSNDYVDLALNYIEENYANPNFSVKNVAEFVKIDRTYLYRLFKDETGLSVIDYINRHRISQAESMLSDQSLAIKDVAYSVGFSDQMYFSKVFKKHTGKTPTEYKRLIVEKESHDRSGE